jgi:hypothetical protein
MPVISKSDDRLLCACEFNRSTRFRGNIEPERLLPRKPVPSAASSMISARDQRRTFPLVHAGSSDR